MEKKEAMKILKEFRDKSALFSVRTALDTVIPELKESEDEKVIKTLIHIVKGACDKYGIKYQGTEITKEKATLLNLPFDENGEVDLSFDSISNNYKSLEFTCKVL